VLQIEELEAGYDGLPVLHKASVSVRPGSMVAVIGPNGAGKSTLLRAASGLIKPSGGSVSVDGRRLRFVSEADVVKAGVAHVPEGRQVFANLSVETNLRLGAFAVRRRTDVRERIDQMLELFPDLSGRLGDYAGSLSGGQQQMLAIARGLMSSPRYLMLDEPSLGLAPLVVEKIFSVLLQLRQQGVGILLVEQNGRMALAKADEGCLLEQGVVTMSGTGRKLLNNPAVVERYLGVGSSIGVGEAQRQLARRISAALRR
jgi:branched-chain amino acid transport system ATP-binding protein